MMKTLIYITPQIPYPPTSGGKIKTLSTLKILIRLGYSIILFSLIENKDEIKYVQYLKKIGIEKVFFFPNKEVLDRNLFKRVVRFLKSIFTIYPYGVLRYFNADLNKGIKEFLKNNSVHIFWANYAYMAQYLPNNLKIIKILESHDVDSFLYKSAFISATQKQQKLYFLFEWVKFSIYERIVFKRFNKIFSISYKDKILLTNLIDKKNIVILPAAVENKKKLDIKRCNKILLFIGSLSWYPNQDGILWFINKVYPTIKQTIPQIRLWIIGKYPKNFNKVNSNGINFLGFVTNLEFYIQKACIFIAPIRYGTGIRYKILEAMAYGIPVVTTKVGAEGIKVKNYKELLIVNSEKKFAQKVIYLLKNKKLQNTLINNSKITIMKHYSNRIASNIINKELNNYKYENK